MVKYLFVSIQKRRYYIMEKIINNSAFAKVFQSDAYNYIESVLSSSTNYVQRFFAFLGFTQLLYLFLFIVIRLFGWFGWFKLIAFITLIFFGVGIVFIPDLVNRGSDCFSRFLLPPFQIGLTISGLSFCFSLFCFMYLLRWEGSCQPLSPISFKIFTHNIPILS